jgi:hypothetical protein
MSEDRLREAYSEALRRRPAGDRAGCVSGEQLLALAEGHLAEADALAVADHAMACAQCREEYALLRSMIQAKPESASAVPRRLALAASVVLVLGAAAIWQVVRARAGEQMRGGAAAVQLVQPDARAGSALTLVWHRVPGATRYDVELLDASGATLHQATARDTSLIVPPTVRLSAGAEHRWWVRAVLADGREIRSNIETFRIR